MTLEEAVAAANYYAGELGISTPLEGERLVQMLQLVVQTTLLAELQARTKNPENFTAIESELIAIKEILDDRLPSS